MSLAVIAGSGLGGLAGIMDVRHRVPFADIAGVGAAKIAGHAGEVLAGRVEGRDCQFVLGRRHFYEGDDRPIHRLIDHLVAQGATSLVVTSAAGSLRRWMRPGDLVVIRDIIDHQNRRRFSPPDEPAAAGHGVRVDASLTRVFERAALDAGVPCQPGTMFCTSGPLYETSADVACLQYADGDVATMSGAPEVTRANQLGLPAVAVAVVTNPCTGIDSAIPSHQEVLEAGGRAARGLAEVIRQFIVKV